MIEQVDRRLWTYGGPLSAGVSHHWLQDTGWGRLRWFLGFPYAYPAQATHVPEVEVERVWISRHTDGSWPPDNDFWRVHVIIRNVGAEFVQSYAIWVAQTMPVTAVTRDRRLLVVHDAHGTIRSVGVAVDQSEGAITLVPDADEHVSEVEAGDLLGPATAPDAAPDLAATHRLELGDGAPRLVPR
jgi:hypothetical protein